MRDIPRLAPDHFAVLVASPPLAIRIGELRDGLRHRTSFVLLSLSQARRSRRGTRSARIESLSGRGSPGFVRARATGQVACVYSRERGRPTANCKPYCNRGRSLGSLANPSMRTTGSVVERGWMRRLHCLPGSVTAAGRRPGCCSPVLHAGDLDAQASKYVQTAPEAVGTSLVSCTHSVR